MKLNSIRYRAKSIAISSSRSVPASVNMTIFTGAMSCSAAIPTAAPLTLGPLLPASHSTILNLSGQGELYLVPVTLSDTNLVFSFHGPGKEDPW